jgi:DNA-binding transcriptional LysR family regulator
MMDFSPMNSLVNLRSLNLNQLPILRELLRHESITKAATSLNLSQPAVSNVLKTLRGHFGDELLVRDGTKMSRTVKGQELLSVLEPALVHIESAIKGSDFDPLSAVGPVRIAAVDNLLATFAGPMCKLLEKEAPNLQLQFVFASRDLAADLKSGAADIAITSTVFLDSPGISESLRNEIHTQQIGVERLACIARRGDKELANGLSLETYMSRPHASYIVDPDHPHTVERQLMRQLDINRPVRVATSCNQSLLSIVADSDCLAIVPATMAMSGAKRHRIQIFRPPVDLPDIKWVVAWHQRLSNAPLIRWSIDAMMRVRKELKV